MAMMARRLVFRAIKDVDWESLALPAALGPTEVLVRTARTVISAGTEIAVFSGTHIGYSIPGAKYPHMPYYPGFAAAGTVEAVGSAVTTLAPGDRVLGKTGHQDWVVVDIGEENLDCIPEGVSSEAACLGVWLPSRCRASGWPASSSGSMSRCSVKGCLDNSRAKWPAWMGR